MKWYVTTCLMADDRLYVGTTQEDYGEEITVSEHDTEDEAEKAAREYSKANGIPLFEEYQEV